MSIKNDKCSFFEQSFTASENRYYNLNLNQNKKCSILVPVQSYSKSNKDKYCVSDNYKEKEKLQSWNKSFKTSTFTTFNEDNNDLKKQWKNKNISNTTNKSTLSFHISAYENFIEAAGLDLFDNENIERLKKEKFGSIKSSKQSFTGAFKFQNLFEFPRQQSRDQINEPEVMQFSASQRLLDSKQPTLSQQIGNNDKQFVQPQMAPGYGTSVVLNVSKMETEVEDTSVFETTVATSYTKSDSFFQPTSNNITNADQSQLAALEDNDDVVGIIKVLRYTTSIATISTPKNAIRVASRRKPPFTPDTFKLSLCSPRDTIIQSPFPASRTLDLPKPSGTSTPQCSIRRRPDRSQNSSESIICFETTSVYVHDEDYKKCIERLERKVIFEEKHIAESVKKIAFWKRKDNNKFSMNELCAHALLLISKTRLRTYQELVTRVQTLHRMSIVPPSIAKPLRASFTIYSMQINLCRGYYVTGPDCGENYVFLITFSTGEKVVATEIIQGNDTENIRARRLRVDEPVHLSSLPMIFQIKMDIYALKIVAPTSRSPRELAKKAFNFIGTCRTPGNIQQNDEASDSEEDESAFKSVGHAYLTRDSDGHTSFLITENEYPLDGSMEMKCEVSKLPEGLTQPMSGFWNLCGDSGFNKLWVKMVNGILHFYDHPDGIDDENFIEPIYLIDMSTICNRQVEREMTVFKDAEHKFTFYMDVLSFPRGSDLCEHKRYLISVETEEILQTWLTKINNCLNLIRDRPSAS